MEENCDKLTGEWNPDIKRILQEGKDSMKSMQDVLWSMISYTLLGCTDNWIDSNGIDVVN